MGAMRARRGALCLLLAVAAASLAARLRRTAGAAVETVECHFSNVGFSFLNCGQTAPITRRASSQHSASPGLPLNPHSSQPARARPSDRLFHLARAHQKPPVTTRAGPCSSRSSCRRVLQTLRRVSCSRLIAATHAPLEHAAATARTTAMGRAQAQATAQRTQAITNLDSFQLVKCLIRVSVYHVCWMRGLFPEDAFTGHDLAQLDQLHVKMLEPDEEDNEATTLKNWVEQGVMDAVAKGYLKNMYFGIAQDAAATNLLEEYIYSFKYGPDGVEFEMSAEARGGSNKKKDKYSSVKGSKERGRPGVDDVRYQVVRLMRMLVQLCQTLDKVPEQRYLFIKLTYHDHTPEDYEPPFFHGVAEEGIGHFHRRPFSMDVGCMDTHHHTVSVRVKSVLDSCDDDNGDDNNEPREDPMLELQGSIQQVPAADEGPLEAVTPPCSQETAGTNAGAATATAGTAAMTATAHQLSVPTSTRLRTEEALDLLTATEDQLQDDTLAGCELMDTDEVHVAAAAAAAGGGAEKTLLHSNKTLLHNSKAPRTANANNKHSSNSQDDTRLTGGNDDMEQQPEASEADGDVYECVRAFCLAGGRARVSWVDLLTAFYQVDEGQLGQVLEGLMREGLLQAGPLKDSYTVLQPNNPAATSEGVMAEAGLGSGGSCAAPNATNHTNNSSKQQQQLKSKGQRVAAAADDDDAMLTDKMSELSVGAAAAGAAAAAAGRRGRDGMDLSVCGAAMHAGSLMTGQPGGAAGAPTAATPQMRGAAAGDEPSVQLQQDQQQSLWFDASQQSYQGPHTAGAGAKGAAAGAAGAAAARSNSRLRKASYVNSPIHQHPGKRGPGSRLHQQQQQEQEREDEEKEKENDGGDKGCADADMEAKVVQDQQQKQRQQKQKRQGGVTAAAGAAAKAAAAAAADTAAAGGDEMKAPRRKVAVRKPKKPQAAAAAPAVTPTRAGGRLAAMRG